MEIISNETLQVLKILQLPKIGPASFRKMYLKNRNCISDSENKNFSVEIMTKCDKIIEDCSKNSIKILSVYDSVYPKLLASIKDYPPVIYVKGNINIISSECIAIVGTRHPSNYGTTVAKKIAFRLALAGKTIVSGLAMGIDTAAHSGTLEANGNTIAVLAHGLDIIAPKQSTELAEDILQKGGALVSEHEPGVPAFPPEFARRNRIQSGLSVASIVVESGIPGGSLIQAKFTYEQNRMLFTVIKKENSKFSDFNSSGGDYIIKNYNAKTICDYEDLYQKLLYNQKVISSEIIQKELFDE